MTLSPRPPLRHKRDAFGAARSWPSSTAWDAAQGSAGGPGCAGYGRPGREAAGALVYARYLRPSSNSATFGRYRLSGVECACRRVAATFACRESYIPGKCGLSNTALLCHFGTVSLLADNPGIYDDRVAPPKKYRHRVLLSLGDDTHAALERLSETSGTPVAAIIRELLDQMRPQLQAMEAAIAKAREGLVEEATEALRRGLDEAIDAAGVYEEQLTLFEGEVRKAKQKREGPDD